jgi:integrase
LRPRTRSDYSKLLDKSDDVFGDLSLGAMSARHIAEPIYRWRDSMQKSPRRADYAVQVLKALLSWGKKRGLLEHNRAADVGRLYHGDRRDKTWSDEQIAAFLGSAPEPLCRALTLAIETGQRQADLLVLPWAAVHGETIRLRQQKTGARVTVPIPPALRLCLDGIAKGETDEILTKADGKPWDSKGNGFRAAWRDAAKTAGVKGVTFHDLRGTFVTRRLSQGWTTQEVAMCTGHSLRNLASLDTYADRETISEATAMRLSKRQTSTS